ncbi:hypothetical protein SCP_1502290 [Sparassis crispa]|uniref:Uncharacterized protein n=1 Tax=Sparassis crispa TaxID=139825 RepID=A0A401H494_9APHY|nr:hypothetical protein SCP_1502290 [Sparassis crispa]GBE89221.1 hypothetical protein SCP_1502290 [Sparassis crispa]
MPARGGGRHVGQGRGGYWERLSEHLALPAIVQLSLFFCSRSIGQVTRLPWWPPGLWYMQRRADNLKFSAWVVQSPGLSKRSDPRRNAAIVHESTQQEDHRVDFISSTSCPPSVSLRRCPYRLATAILTVFARRRHPPFASSQNCRSLSAVRIVSSPSFALRIVSPLAVHIDSPLSPAVRLALSPSPSHRPVAVVSLSSFTPRLISIIIPRSRTCPCLSLR